LTRKILHLDGDVEQDYRLQTTLDELRDRFGDQAIQQGDQLKKDDTLEKE
jgi:hypothetical protein